MLDVVGWLREVEELASAAYSAAAKTATLPQELREFLERLAEDESLHYHLMGSAAELIRSQKEFPAPAIQIDAQSGMRITAPLRDIRGRADRGELTADDVLCAVVLSESSEWNDIFLYVINICTNVSREFQHTAASIQSHERRIEEYLLDKDVRLACELRALPKIWESNVLVVEDDPAVRTLFARIASGLGKVTTAENGQAALREIEEQFFNVIVSDVDMPFLDGLSLLRRVAEKEPRLASHFIICTADPSREVVEVTEELGVPLLVKPVTIQALRDTLERVLSESL